MLRVLTLSTLFPNSAQPNFGVFVGNQTRALAARPGVELRVVNPLPLPPWPFSLHSHYRKLRDLPAEESWHGLKVARPPMWIAPGLSGPRNPGQLVRAARPILRRWWDEGFRFDVIDAQFFFPDGPAITLAREFGVPCSIKARGADIHFWGARRGCAEQVREAGRQADGMLAVSASLRRDMIAMGMPGERILVHHTAETTTATS